MDRGILGPPSLSMSACSLPAVFHVQAVLSVVSPLSAVSLPAGSAGGHCLQVVWIYPRSRSRGGSVSVYLWVVTLPL